jgi:uncharacterized membrane protein
MGAYLASSLVIGIGLAVWRIVLMFQYYDPYNNEYASQAKAPLQTLGYVIAFALLLMATSYFFIRKNRFENLPASCNQISVFASALLGFVFLAVACLIALYYAKELFAQTSATTFRFLRLTSFALLFPSALYFIINATSRCSEKMKKVFSFFPTLFAVIFLATSYINPIYNYTDPNHNLCNISICSLVLFFLFETRACATNRTDATRFVFSLIALVCTLVYILPIFILMAFWELSTGLDLLFEAVECGALRVDEYRRRRGGAHPARNTHDGG